MTGNNGEKRIDVEKIPVFCPDCRRKNTFIRNELQDIKYVSGKIMEKTWVCMYCGYVAYEYAG